MAVLKNQNDLAGNDMYILLWDLLYKLLLLNYLHQLTCFYFVS